MDFGQLITNIFGSDWFNGIKDTLFSLVSIVITVTYYKIKNKLSDTTNSTNETVNAMSNAVAKMIKTNEELVEKNKSQQEEITKLQEGIISIGDMVSVSFMGSKAIPADAKVQISKSVAKLAELGLNVESSNIALEPTKKTVELAVEVVNDIKEKAKTATEELTKQAENTNNKTIEVYNEIINE